MSNENEHKDGLIWFPENQLELNRYAITYAISVLDIILKYSGFSNEDRAFITKFRDIEESKVMANDIKIMLNEKSHDKP